MNNTIQSFLQQAQTALNNGDVKKALSFYAQILQIDSEYYLAHYNIGNIFLNLGRYEEAIKYYTYSIDFNETYVNAYTNIGIAYTNVGDYAKAIFYLEKGLSIDPLNTLCLNNLGNALKALKKFQEAILNYQKAIKLNPAFKEAHNGLASVLEEVGLFKQALIHYEKAINIDKNYLEANLNLLPLLIQFNPLKKIKSTYPQSSVFLYKIIHSFIYKSSKNTLSLINEIKAKELKFSSYEQQQFGLSYLKFISQLINYKPSSNNYTNSILYHIGESHSLSFAHHKANINNTLYSIKPLIIFGTKAFHLQKNKINKYKFYFENYISHLKKGDLVLLSFGEIDCRANEGIIPYHLKTKESLEKTIKDTVNDYLIYTSDILKSHHLRFTYLTLPAPIIKEKNIENSLRVKTIKIFNDTLKKITQQLKLHIVDTYSLTIDKNNESNMKYMCDEYHLSPEILEKLKFDF